MPKPFIFAAAVALLGPYLTCAAEPLPQSLRDTGLYVAGSVTAVRSGNLAFSPQYPLWSDGAAKRRWLHVPSGASIDASHPDEWDFPRGTKLWKEFSYDRKVETRLIQRLDDGHWRFATYVWNDQQTDAMLAPAEGIPALRVPGAPGGRYAIPGEGECRACHEGGAVPVLGASTLQLSPERDPGAPHAESRKASEADLATLVERGWLRNLPPSMLSNPPRIAGTSPIERAALGYLHGNCGHCHNDSSAAPPVGVLLAQDGSLHGKARVMRTLIGAPSRFRGHGLAAAAPLVAPGLPQASVLLARMRSRDPQAQMPPIGTRTADRQAIELIEAWIAQLQLPKGPAQ
jgi:hypothetical protein